MQTLDLKQCLFTKTSQGELAFVLPHSVFDLALDELIPKFSSINTMITFIKQVTVL